MVNNNNAILSDNNNSDLMSQLSVEERNYTVNHSDDGFNPDNIAAILQLQLEVCFLLFVTHTNNTNQVGCL